MRIVYTINMQKYRKEVNCARIKLHDFDNFRGCRSCVEFTCVVVYTKNRIHKKYINQKMRGTVNHSKTGE